MDIETIKERGVPPYKISNGGGTVTDNGGLPDGKEQFTYASTFSEAIGKLADVTDYGLQSQGSTIIDSKGQIVFNLDQLDDLTALLSLREKLAD